MTQNTEGISKCCLSGKLHEGVPSGTDSKLGNLDAYFTGEESNKSRTILFITDIFGFKLNNARLLADEYAQAGFYVVMPDLFDGDFIDDNLLSAIAPLPSSPDKSLVEKTAEGAKVGVTLPPWLAKHREAVVKPLIEDAIRSLRADSQVKKIGAVGFCWGGRYAVLLTHKNSEQYVDAAVANHPSFLDTAKELDDISRPLLVNVGDQDSMFPADKDLVKLKEVFLKRKGDLATGVNVYKGAVHGFAVRADLNNETERKQKEEAAEATIQWFKDHL